MSQVTVLKLPISEEMVVRYQFEHVLVFGSSGKRRRCCLCHETINKGERWGKLISPLQGLTDQTSRYYSCFHCLQARGVLW